jgi:hypothetical protein
MTESHVGKIDFPHCTFVLGTPVANWFTVRQSQAEFATGLIVRILCGTGGGFQMVNHCPTGWALAPGKYDVR